MQSQLFHNAFSNPTPAKFNDAYFPILFIFGAGEEGGRGEDVQRPRSTLKQQQKTNGEEATHRGTIRGSHPAEVRLPNNDTQAGRYSEATTRRRTVSQLPKHINHAKLRKRAQSGSPRGRRASTDTRCETFLRTPSGERRRERERNYKTAGKAIDERLPESDDDAAEEKKRTATTVEKVPSRPRHPTRPSRQRHKWDGNSSFLPRAFYVDPEE